MEAGKKVVYFILFKSGAVLEDSVIGKFIPILDGLNVHPIDFQIKSDR